MKAVIFAFTRNGVSQAVKIHNFLKTENYEPTIFTTEDYAVNDVKIIKPNLKTLTEQAFTQCKLIIFIGSLGIAVRTIAPFIKDKTKDPAVLCIDDLGRYVIPVLSGHIGGANAVSNSIAKMLNAIAIITTATDINGVFSVDEWATKQGLFICDIKKVKKVAKSLLDGKQVGLYTKFNIMGNLPNGIVSDINCKTGISIALNENDKPFENTLTLLPQIIHIGVGCRKNTSFDDVENAILKTLEDENISINSVSSMASIDLKKNETGLLKFAEIYKLPITFYSANELESVSGNFTKSDFVKKITSVDNVCERSAVLSSNNGRLIKNKTVINGVTVSIAMAKWSISFENKN